MRTSDKRERLVNAATTLIHHQGYGQTTLADIAEASGVPLGNVYYYFKTKEEIAAAVIDERLQQLRARLQDLEHLADPRARLIAFVEAVGSERKNLAEHGCAIGSLCQELNKERTVLSEKADGILKTQLQWLVRQFRLLEKEDANDLGHELMARLQGISLLAYALHSPGLAERQLRRIKAWLQRV